MNTYKYNISDGEGHGILRVRMTPSDRKIFNYCLRHGQKGGLAPLNEYLKSKNLSILYEDIIPHDEDSTDEDADFIYEYHVVKKVYKFDVVTLDPVYADVSVYIQIPEILFDRCNDLVNLGDVPHDLRDIVCERLNTQDSSWILECDRESDGSIIDYVW